MNQDTYRKDSHLTNQLEIEIGRYRGVFLEQIYHKEPESEEFIDIYWEI